MNYTIKEIPEMERPREKLESLGSENLSDAEVLAILIKTGTKSKRVTDLAMELLKSIGDITSLKNATIPSLMKINGIGKVKAIELIATVELGKRIYKKNNTTLIKYTNAESIYKSFKYLFLDKKQECFYALYFDNQKKLIGRKLLFMGTINKSIVHPREIFKEAYLLSASSIICMHNHPSGNIAPSRDDIIFTNSIKDIGIVQGIPVVDHIIVGEETYYSFYENKYKS